MIKRLAAFLLTITIFLLFCSCKDEEKTESKEAATSEITVSSGDFSNDATVDPQNTEIGRPLGETVSAESIKPKKGMSNGVDVSKWQGKIDWSTVKKQGIDFAVIRIGYRGENGNIYKDDYADYNIQQASKAGLLVGVYFFSTAVNVNEAVGEADWVKENIKYYPISLPVVYDCEGFSNATSRMAGLTNAQRTDNALAFINQIKSSGYAAMHYASKSDLESFWETERIEQVADIWVAHYPAATYPQVKNPQYNGEYTMWQYTNKGVVKGISDNVDLIVSYKKFTKKTSKLQGKVTEVSAPKPADNTYKAVNDSVTAKDVVNLRAQATTTSKIVGELHAGTYLNRLAIGSNGWSKLNYNGQTVYAVSSFLTNEAGYKKPQESSQAITPSDGFDAVSDKVTPKISVNLRTQPTTDSDIVAEVQNGIVLQRIGKNSAKGWSKISYNGQTVYAVTSYLTTELSYQPPIASTPAVSDGFEAVSDQVTPKISVNLRTQPTTDSDIVAEVQNGTILQRIGKNSAKGWSKISYNGQTVYAVTSYLEEK